MSGRLVTERLLATTSLAALMMAALSGEASAQACTTVGAGGSYNSAGSVPCVTVTGNAVSVTNNSPDHIGPSSAAPSTGAVAVTGTGALSGGITNSGTIAGKTTGAISVGIGVKGLVQGGITNSGTVTAHDKAIQIFGTAASFVGNISNSGTVTATNTAVRISTPTFNGSVVNSSTGTISSGGSDTAAVVTVSGVSHFSGNISNSGTITTTGFQRGVEVSGSGTFVGGIANAGRIGVFATGVRVDTTTSFGGGIVNSAGGTIASQQCNGALVTGVSVFSGGITNAGAIAAGANVGTTIAAINVNNTSTFSGGITNSGTLSATASSGPCGNAISLNAISSFSGNIVNSAGATMTAKEAAIALGTNVSLFSGGISNAGTITSTSSAGIRILASTFAGGVTNSGSINAAQSGIDINGVHSFGGGILNSAGATILSTSRSGIYMVGTSTFTGGITNNGLISGHASGIDIQGVATFLSGITNTGTITATATGSGIFLEGVSTFTGGISNSGTIGAAGTTRSGIDVANVASFSGGITNTGAIAGAGLAGLGLFNVTSFFGNISNNGTITGHTGIVLSHVGMIDGAIVNSGTIEGTGGTAIDLSTAGGAITIDQTGGTILGAILFSGHGDTLSGYGTVVGNLTQGNATIAPTLGGNNMLKIAGNLTQGASSNTVIEVSPAAAAQLNVTGTASIAGALKVVYDPGTYTNKTYSLVHAGTLTGTYASTSASGAVPTTGTQTISYTGTDVDLTLAGLANANPSPPMTITTTTGAFGNLANLALGGASDTDGIVFDHLDEQQFGQGSDQVKTALAGAAPIRVAMNGPLQQLAQASTQLPNALAPYGGWVRGIGDFMDVDNHNGASGFSASGGGVLAGIDHPFGPVTAGIAAGYSGTNFTQNDGESGDVQTIRALLYAHYHAAPRVLVDGIAGFAYDRIHTNRPIASLGANATESHNAFEENLAVQAGYVMPWQGFTVIPRIGAQYVHLSENQFSETGASGFDLSRGRENVDSFQPSIGIGALKAFALDNGMRVTPEFKLTYSHELLNPNETLALTTPSAAIVPASVVTPAHNIVTLGPSVTLRLNDRIDLYADYKLSIGIGKSTDNVIFAGARFTW